jgi:hypothetical protein
MPLKQQKHLMFDTSKETLHQRGLMAAYDSRPAHQQNAYISSEARCTKQKRLNQMLDELEAGK